MCRPRSCCLSSCRAASPAREPTDFGFSALLHEQRAEPAFKTEVLPSLRLACAISSMGSRFFVMHGPARAFPPAARKPVARRATRSRHACGILGPTGGMAMPDRKVVWILGAGFSQSLGAPLLADLFTEESARRVRINGAKVGPRLDGIDDVVRLCQAGTYDLPHSKPIERQWKHAEEFLERLDLAARKPGRNGYDRANLSAFAYKMAKERGTASNEVALEFMSKVDDDNVGRFRELAVRLLAAEVCEFVEDANLEHESWSPYVTWADTLDLNDTVILQLRSRSGTVVWRPSGTTLRCAYACRSWRHEGRAEGRRPEAPR